MGNPKLSMLINVSSKVFKWDHYNGNQLNCPMLDHRIKVKLVTNSEKHKVQKRKKNSIIMYNLLFTVYITVMADNVYVDLLQGLNYYLT